jgi:serine protease AprX
VVAPFSGRGPSADGVAKPDLVAPGVSIPGIRAAGSTIDQHRPARAGNRHYLEGTGTSQAAAVVSGIAALLYDADPALRPDVAKAALVGTAQRRLAGQPGAGAGLVDARAAVAAVERGTYASRPANQGLRPSTGLGSLEAARGTRHAYTDLNGDGAFEPIVGEVDALGRAWDAAGWTATPWTGSTWSRSSWPPLMAEPDGGDVKHWNGDAWSGMAPDPRPWQVKHWNEQVDDPSAWLVKHWNASSFS